MFVIGESIGILRDNLCATPTLDVRARRLVRQVAPFRQSNLSSELSLANVATCQLPKSAKHERQMPDERVGLTSASR